MEKELVIKKIVEGLSTKTFNNKSIKNTSIKENQGYIELFDRKIPTLRKYSKRNKMRYERDICNYYLSPESCKSILKDFIQKNGFYIISSSYSDIMARKNNGSGSVVVYGKQVGNGDDDVNYVVTVLLDVAV